MKEIGLQYYDCSGNPQIDYVVSKLQESRYKAALQTFKHREHCINIFEEGKIFQSSFKGLNFFFNFSPLDLLNRL